MRSYRRKPYQRKPKSMLSTAYGYAKQLAPYASAAYNIVKPLVMGGSGEYQTMQQFSRRPNIKLSAPQMPMMTTTKDGFTVRHREFVSDLAGSGPFAIWSPGSQAQVAAGIANTLTSGWRLNPADPQTFPWLSGIAASFEQYEFKNIVVEYVPTCGDALSSTNNALGSIMMAVEYNSAVPVSSTKAQILEGMWAVSGKPSDHKCMPVECKRTMNPVNKLYCSPSLAVANADPRLYDLGYIEIATQGMQAVTSTLQPFLGEIYISYEVTFYKPQTTTNVPQYIKYSSWRSQKGVGSTLGVAAPTTFSWSGITTNLTAGLPFITYQGQQNLLPSLSFINGNTNLITFPTSGYWTMIFNMSGPLVNSKLNQSPFGVTGPLILNSPTQTYPGQVLEIPSFGVQTAINSLNADYWASCDINSTDSATTTLNNQKNNWFIYVMELQVIGGPAQATFNLSSAVSGSAVSAECRFIQGGCNGF